MLDTTAWPGSVDLYVDTVVWLGSRLLTDPKHFFRSFTVKELGRLITARPTEPVVRTHEMGIYKRYFDLIASGQKTTEIRVDDSSRKKNQGRFVDPVPLPGRPGAHPRHASGPLRHL
ncbi:ASCH domain-containing protein [Saccharopolyspora phatthalungensis]|uniref:ASCH domain-containing protein n=1 Tax=Saccharopolyspora phatthalungensis TaxID=664693 RepID=A0A840PXB7_9PSEU|nr:ASCH domain-containing protein [Saccharopolyspora phatthalungensis]MBB5152564.1 hypothetical protein [Saccharopolyspora phatthalungensis]